MMYRLRHRGMELIVRHVGFEMYKDDNASTEQFAPIRFQLIARPMANPMAFFNHVKLMQAVKGGLLDD